MDRRSREFRKQIESAKKGTTAPAEEVLRHVYRGILSIPEFTLSDGTKARLDPYIEPEVGEGGDATCGFDVLLDNGSHLEFTVTNTGWGRSIGRQPSKELGNRRRGRGR